MSVEVKEDMQNSSFIFYRSFYESIECLEDTSKLEFYKVLFEYALNGIELEAKDKVVTGLFKMAKPLIDSTINKRINGRRGGRPKATVTERIEIEGIEYVNLSQTDYDKLVAKYGKSIIDKSISILDEWLSKGGKTAKQYIGKNHYAHFRSDSWVIEKAKGKLKDEQQEGQPNWSV